MENTNLQTFLLAVKTAVNNGVIDQLYRAGLKLDTIIDLEQITTRFIEKKE